jgi:hypothetical protein
LLVRKPEASKWCSNCFNVLGQTFCIQQERQDQESKNKNGIRGNSSQIDDRVSTVAMVSGTLLEWGMRSTSKMAWPARTQRRAPKQDPHRYGDDGNQMILKETEIE